MNTQKHKLQRQPRSQFMGNQNYNLEITVTIPYIFENYKYLNMYIKQLNFRNYKIKMVLNQQFSLD